MYTLCYSPGSASFVVHWMLIELDVPHELQRIDLAAGEHKQPAYLALNPNGVVPTLLIDGAPASEAAALVMYLADAHPGSGLAPACGVVKRAAYNQWMLYLANSLQPAFRHWFYPQEAAGEAAAEQAREHVRQRIEAVWQRLDSHLQQHGPYLLGERPCAADFMLTMLMRWSRNMPRPAGNWPALSVLIEKMKARPSFSVLNQREGLTEWT